jgi:hypothetical protein
MQMSTATAAAVVVAAAATNSPFGVQHLFAMRRGVVFCVLLITDPTSKSSP